MNKKPAGPIDPKVFNLNEWISGIKAPTKTVPLYQKGALVGDLEKLRQEIGRAEAMADYEDDERGVADGDPVADLVTQYDELLTEFEASRLDFTLRAYVEDDRRICKAEMVAAGMTYPLAPRDLGEDPTAAQIDAHYAELVEFEDAKAAYENEMALRMTARCLVSPVVDTDQARAIRQGFGEVQFSVLIAAWAEASMELPEAPAPLSRRPSPTRTTEK